MTSCSDWSTRLRAGQATFDDTGGLHGAAVFDPSGSDALASRRHRPAQRGRQGDRGARQPTARPAQLVLVVSGRISFEIVQKAAVAGLPVVCGISAASSLAIELAEELGMTLIGFLRGSGCNVYTGVDRIQSLTSAACDGFTAILITLTACSAGTASGTEPTEPPLPVTTPALRPPRSHLSPPTAPALRNRSPRRQYRRPMSVPARAVRM